ncbi:MAG: IS21-like element helper ATPase IstB [Bacteroidales bacterium]|nr:IS21-like element helper ATPase IstB [Bacteroidales bacterium]
MASNTPNQSQKQIEQFIDNCDYLGLKNLAQEYQKIVDKAGRDTVGYYEFIREIVQAEAAVKRKRRTDYLIKKSRLPKPLKMIAGYDFDFQPRLDRRLVMDLATLEFLARRESVLYIGDVGTGKSHLAQSLGMMACQNGYRTYYTTCSDLINDLKDGAYDNTLKKRIKKYINPDLLLIDEMGHDRLELEAVKEAHLLFKVIDQRYNNDKSLIFTTNINEEDWAEFLGDPISTSAILDRIFHHSIIVEIRGPSYRKYQSELLQKKYGAKRKDEKNPG